MGYGTDLQKQQYAVVQGLRSSGQQFKAEVPMDRVLDRLVEGQNLGKLYNPHAFYVRYREFYIDWMCTLCGELDHQPETFHHAVNTLACNGLALSSQNELDAKMMECMAEQIMYTEQLGHVRADIARLSAENTAAEGARGQANMDMDKCDQET